MKIIGLTGGIGTGKSTAADYLKQKGLVHIDADDISRSLTAEGSRLLPVLDRTFGPEAKMGVPGIKVLNADGTLDRKALASVVFSDTSKKDRLNDIMFGEIIRIIDERIETSRNIGASAVLIDAPLLFESGLDSKCDIIILITADLDTRIDRVCARDGVSAQDVMDRIKNQMSDEKKAAGSDMIIDNSGTQQEFILKLEDVIRRIL